MAILPDFFKRYLPIIEEDVKSVLSPEEDDPEQFYTMMHYHMGWVDPEGNPEIRKGGKRIRPILSLLVSEAFCGDHNPARPTAAAVETIHNFTLLHDDIEDRSPLRRGYPTSWTVWGEAQSINSGDAMFSLAQLSFFRLPAPDGNMALVAHLMRLLNEACLKLTRGQFMDISFESRQEVTTDEYLTMITGKTAALISAAAHMGALSAGADQTTRRHYRDFGHNLGMAFQVLDDILDIWGKPEQIGKQAAVDIVQRKKSLPVLYGMERIEELQAIYADPEPFDDMTVKKVIRLLDDIDARGYAKSIAKEYSIETTRHLESAKPEGAAGDALYELVDTLLNRES